MEQAIALGSKKLKKIKDTHISLPGDVKLSEYGIFEENELVFSISHLPKKEEGRKPHHKSKYENICRPRYFSGGFYSQTC